MKRFLHFLLIVVFSVNVIHISEQSRILAVIPTPSYSHQVFFQRLWQELAFRGHQVVVMTTDPTWANITTLKEIDLSSAYKVAGPIYQQIIDISADSVTADLLSIEVFYQVALHELALPQVQELLNDPSEHFDLVIVEFLYPFFFGMGYHFKCPIIGVTSIDAGNDDHNAMGNAVHSVKFPNMLIGTQIGSSFMERLTSYYFEYMIHLNHADLTNKINVVNNKFFGDNCPDHNYLKENVDMLFTNNNPLFSPVRPISPSTISIAGGLHLNHSKPLPAKVKKFLDASSQGVVYFSMGTNVKSNNFPKHTMTVLLETFAQLPYNVVWKFEDDHLPGRPANVIIMKWVPQQDVLKHKNIKLFITQAGRQSLEEALVAHVPLIVMPFFIDQEGNSAIATSKGVALHLNYRTLSVEKLKNAIMEIINNPKYKENMKTLAMQVQDQPMTALERAVWWTEYILRHKSGKHLKGAKIPIFFDYYYDILLFVIGCILAVFAVAYLIYVIILKTTCNKVKKA